MEHLKISSASVNEYVWDGLKYANILCPYGKRAFVKISKIKKNKNKLYYSCDKKNYGVSFIGWSMLIKISVRCL